MRLPPNSGPGICHWSVPVPASRAEVLPKPFVYEGHNRMGKGCRARIPLQLVGAIHLLCKVSLSSRFVVPKQASNLVPSMPVYQLRWSPRSASSARNEAALSSEFVCCRLVCLAVWQSAAAQDVTGKLAAVFFPVMAFVSTGMELLDWSCSVGLLHICMHACMYAGQQFMQYTHSCIVPMRRHIFSLAPRWPC
jgi:hypothetical protein